MKKNSATFLFSLVLLVWLATGCTPDSKQPKISGSSGDSAVSRRIKNRTPDGLKLIRLPLLSRAPTTLDPAQAVGLEAKQCVAQIYEPLLQFNYFQRPLELEPLLLDSMVEISDDRKTFTFRLKKGIYFHDDDCFENGKGCELTADDVLYSWKRLADPDVGVENWWLFEGLIVGLDEYREELMQRKKSRPEVSFDYDVELEGMQKLTDYEFRIVLRKAHPRFRWMLAMPQLSIVPHEAVSKYGDSFKTRPVGTGPFLIEHGDWIGDKKLVMTRNPSYRKRFSPGELGSPTAPSAPLPLVDRIETIFYDDQQTMWMEFRSRKLSFTTVPGPIYFDEAFDRQQKTLKSNLLAEGISSQRVPLMDFIFFGFNMEDTLLGGYTDDKRYLRQSIALAIDWEKRNEVFYDGLCTIYDGMIPPGLDGFPPNGEIRGSYRGPDLERAKELISKAGFPDGQRLPPIPHFLTDSEFGSEMAAMTKKQLGEIGVEIDVQRLDFESFMKRVDQRQAPMFYFSWVSDYPDAENNLALFYGPNQSPGKNYFNYQNDEFDKIYEQTLEMPPGPARTALYVKLRNMVIRDCAYIGSMARNRVYLVNPELKNFLATETFHNWYKYLDVE